MKALLATIAAIAVTGSLFAAPEVGKPAPDFTLEDLAGKKHNLSDYTGKTVVLEWVNFGCPFVKKHYDAKAMQDLQKAVLESGGVWLSICSSTPGKQGNETPDTAAKNLEKYGAAPTAYLRDEDGTVGRLYGARTTPEMFLIDATGKVVYMGAIDDRPSPDPASLDGATNYVRQALDAVRANQPVANAQTKPYGCSVKY